MRVPLSHRLRVIADEVIINKKVADIGTDHGYLPVYLVKHKGVSKVIAADVNQDPLNKARIVIQRHKLQQHIELRLGDGLNVLHEGEASTIIIAGMGGNLISEILDNSPSVAKKAEKLILQPVQSVQELRRYLLENGYEITNEKLMQEKNRFYEILCTQFRNKPWGQIDPLVLEIGEFLQDQDPHIAQAFLRRKIRLTENKRVGMLKSESLDGAEIVEVELLLKKLKEALEWFVK